MDTTIIAAILGAATGIGCTLLTLYHRQIEAILKRRFRRNLGSDGERIRGVDGIMTPTHVIRIDSAYSGRKVITPDEMLHQIKVAVVDPLEREGWVPDLVIGSARGGAVCAGIVATNMKRDAKRLPLRVVDCIHERTGMRPDLAALRPEDLSVVNRILVVESSRKTGQTYAKILEAIRTVNPNAEVRDFALVWAPSDLWLELEPPGMYGYLSDGLNPARLKFPWYF